ncbi:hypothetical protein N8I77_012689 [Diaporthe amygdali]|uniref:MIF4G domain-containing protein n=1 Tax=Phomopsis amygdali TaxID=1214568 RepID=A0AAD9S338_PHOAM|nr:hypothetical protein N8I77_012689 [Diaporthe amygdali]
MTPFVRTKPLNVCVTRCAELIHDLNGVHQFHDLQRQVKALLSSLLAMMRTVHANKLESFDSDPARSPGLSLLAAFLHELRKTCGFYGTGGETEWRLHDEDRAFVLDELSNPFDQVAKKLSHLARTLEALVEDEQVDLPMRLWELCEWGDSIFKHWDFFQGEFAAARGLAAAISAASEHRPTVQTPTIDDGSAGRSGDKTSEECELQRSRAWNKIGEQLAEEGISDDAIEGVADDLKTCVRTLIRGEPLKLGQEKCDSSNSTAKKSQITASSKSNTVSDASEDLFDPEVVSSKVTAALDRIKNDFDIYLPELLVVAFQQQTDKDSRNYRQVLDLIYKMACRCGTRPRFYARLAKEIQTRTPNRFQKIITKGYTRNKAEDAQSDEEPVTGYLFNKCLADWDRGKHERNKISAETFALGLSRFIGELAKYGVFSAEHIHFYIRAQWGPTLKRNQFMAVCMLLKITGPMLDSLSDSSDMDDHFKRISHLINKKKTPDTMKALATELTSLRSSGWKSKESKVMDEVEEAIKKRP